MLNHMVERLDLTFAALADPTRRAMLASMEEAECTIGQLAAPHAMSFAGASKHVSMLERAGLVERRKIGRTHMCRLRPQPLAEAEAWLRQWEHYWDVRFDHLDDLLKGMDQ